MIEQWLQASLLVALAAPGLAFAILAFAAWAGRPLSERATTYVVATAFTCAVLALGAAAVAMSSRGIHEVRVPLGSWFHVEHYRFAIVFVLDRLSLPFAAFGAALVGLVGIFSKRYLHRERGFSRFYLLLTLFGAAIELVVLAGTLDLIFFGWELVGLTSALLIAFFHERAAPVKHGLRAFVIYRVCDVGLLAAAVWLHHSAGTAALSAEAAPWAGLTVPADTIDAAIVGLLLVWAVLGKSAQFPFGGWLPRAMEGPTPSSAIFYGALSIHLGPYLLLRAAPILERSPIVAGAVIAVGAATALHATFVGRVQTDIKSALAYASMTQAGLIFVEIGAGLRFVALVHILGHASIRTLQILRSPSFLHDNHHLELAMGQHLPRTGLHLERWVPRRFQTWLYRAALERGYLDSLLGDWVVGGFIRLVRGMDRMEERWTAMLSGAPMREERDVSERSRGAAL